MLTRFRHFRSTFAGEKLKVALTHATLNDIVLGIAAFNWCVLSSEPQIRTQPCSSTRVEVRSCFLCAQSLPSHRWVRRQSKDLILPPFNAALSAAYVPPLAELRSPGRGRITLGHSR